MAKTVEFVTTKGLPAEPIDSPIFAKKVRVRKDGETIHLHVSDDERAVGPFSKRCGRCGKQIGVPAGLFRPALPVWTDRESLWDNHADRCVPKI